MKYIIYNKKTLKVVRVMNKEPIALTDNLGVARCEIVPQGDNFTVSNIQTHTESWIEKKTVYELQNGEQYNEPPYDLDACDYYLYTEKEIEEVKTIQYQTCDLVPKVYTEKELAAKQRKRYEDLCKQLIAKKYPFDKENQVIRQYLKNSISPEAKARFDEYNAYVEECLAKAKEKFPQ